MHAVEVDRLRGIHMVTGYCLSRLPVGRTGPKGHCGSCATARWETDRSRDVDDFFDEDTFVIRGPALQGLIVIPRRHIGALEELSIPQRAKILAAVRRATRRVREENPWSTPRILPRTDLPASEGHLCFHVQPRVTDDAKATALPFG
jgi:hypothetical protein